MRFRLARLIAAAGALAAVLATGAFARSHPAAAHATRCGCHARAVSRIHAVSRHRHRLWRRSLRSVRVWRGDHQPSQQAWRSERSWSQEDGRWRGETDMAAAPGWRKRPWATDQFGYLTWPGKTREPRGRGLDQNLPPPPQFAPGPPPGEDWRDQPPPPPPPGEDESIDIYRF